jgi:hypothetical protein
MSIYALQSKEFGMLAKAAILKCLERTQVMAPKVMTGVFEVDNEAQQTCGETTNNLWQRSVANACSIV